MSNNVVNYLIGLLWFLVMIGGMYVVKIMATKNAKKAIDEEKYSAFFRKLEGEKAINMTRYALILIDVLFWLFPLTLLIVEIFEFIVYGGLII